MADLCLSSNLVPFAAPLLQQRAQLGVEFGAHGGSLAKLCGLRKQHFATWAAHSAPVSHKPINQVLAEALNFFMGSHWSNVSLARESGVAESTIRNYRDPLKRAAGKSGKEPSAKLTEIHELAQAMGLRVADLVTDATVEERAAIHRQRAAEFYLRHGRLPTWAPPNTNAERDAALA